MPPATSSFLDILRIAAAVIVFVHHCAQFWNRNLYLATVPIAHSAVVVFFVLSGYVIAYSTLAKDRGARRFIVARLSRLYSVVIPALFLTFILQMLGKHLNPPFYSALSRSHDILHYLVTASFLQNVWIFNASPSTNVPFWSLSYEFLYYALFGVAVFVRPRRLKAFALLALSLLAGPNILLLLPCWIVGVVLFRYRERFAAFLTYPRLAFVLSLFVMVAAIAFLPEFPHGLGVKPLFFSGAFLTDWVTAIAVGAAIISFDALRLPPPPEVPASVLRNCADHTFSLYLYHFPLIVFAAAIIPFGKSTFWPPAGAAACILLVIFLLSSLTEAKRSGWRTVIEWVIDRFRTSKASSTAGCS